MTTCQLRMPEQSHLFSYIEENANHGLPMIEANTRVGDSVTICGAGPSLKDHVYPELLFVRGEVWGCNSAYPYLRNEGISVTHAFSIDQSETMLDEWSMLHGVDYLLSSSVSPDLIRQIQSRHGKIRLFHSFLGVPHDTPDYEIGLYRSLYPVSVQVGHGLNSVPRAVCLALAMGFSSITVYGADCGVVGNAPMPSVGEPGYEEWLETVALYADGRKASVYGENASMCEAEIDGRLWHSRPDMIISAVHLLELQQAFPGRITYKGDTLVHALASKDQSFMSRLPALTRTGEVTHFRT